MLVPVLFGVIGSSALGVLFLVRARTTPWLNLAIGLFLLNAAAVFTAIALTHAGAVGDPDGIELFEHALALAAGPLLLAVVLQGTDGERRRFPVVHFAPALLAFAYALLALVFPLRDVVGSLPVIAHQVSYTTVATVVLSTRRAWKTWPALIVLAIWGIHVTQGLRMLAPGNEAIRDVVPVTGTIVLNLFVLVALYHSSLLDKLVPPRRYARSGLDPDTLGEMGGRLLGHMREHRVHRDRALSLAKLAAQLGWREHALSQVINEALGTTFSDLLKDMRIADAKRLLEDPGNDRHSVESLGLEAGFGSRASFYRAFTERERISPAEFRKRTDRARAP